MSDALGSGRKIRTFHVIDELDREALRSKLMPASQQSGSSGF